MQEQNQTPGVIPETDKPPGQPPEKLSFIKQHKKPLLCTLIAVLILLFAGGVALLVSAKSGTKEKVSVSPNTPAAEQANPETAKATNVWKSSVKATAIPLGDGNVSTSPKAGSIYSCTTSFRGNGAQHSGDWLNASAGTWDATKKVAVQGAVSWPNASYSVTENGSNRIITTNDLPEKDLTGIFPIARSDPAHQYDTNPNRISAQNVTYTLPLNPTAASTPQCTGLGAIGVLSNGTLLYNGLDAAGRDAVAHETQDSCNGHPDGGEHYHYHDVSSCISDTATDSSTLVGYALDGYGIYVERDSAGALPTNADLDECHGRTSEVMWNGKMTTIYHYDATLEYPFTIGCFHGTPIDNSRGPKGM